MSFGAGSLTIAASRSGSRTVLERVRYDGISRCSRAFPRGDAALVVLSQLGPGVVRGDCATTHGRVGRDAHLIVTSQTATRLMGGASDARAEATWLVEDDARLDIVGEPLVAQSNASYRARTTIDLARDATVCVSDIAAVAAGARVRLMLSVRRFGRELFYDALDAATAAPGAVGTLAIVGTPEGAVAPLSEALDAAADQLVGVRSGVGRLENGAFVRLEGPDVWAIRMALDGLRGVAAGFARPGRGGSPT